MENETNKNNTLANENEQKNIINSENEQKPEGGETLKQFTQEELDKIVSERLERDRKKQQSIFEKKLDEKLAEQERLSKLSQEEKEKQLTEKAKRDLEDKQKELTIRENKLSGKEKLTELNIPVEFIDFVLSEDLEKMTENIEIFSKKWNEAVNAAVADKLKGDAPRDPNKKGDTATHSGMRSF